MSRYLLVLAAILLAAVTAWAQDTGPPLSGPPPAVSNPPDRQRFEPVTPGLRIKIDRERVDELKQVPAPVESKSQTAPEQVPGGGKTNEK
jgi:hypothetical protein